MYTVRLLSAVFARCLSSFFTAGSRDNFEIARRVEIFSHPLPARKFLNLSSVLYRSSVIISSPECKITVPSFKFLLILPITFDPSSSPRRRLIAAWEFIVDVCSRLSARRESIPWPRDTQRPDDHSWGTLLSSCRVTGQKNVSAHYRLACRSNIDVCPVQFPLTIWLAYGETGRASTRFSTAILFVEFAKSVSQPDSRLLKRAPRPWNTEAGIKEERREDVPFPW